MFLSAILYILMSIVLIFVMKEKVLKEVMHHSMVASKLGLKHIFKHPMLKIFVVTAFLLGLYSEGIDRLEEYIVLDKITLTIFSDLPSIYIVSIMHMVVALLGVIMLLIIKKHVKEGLKVYQWFLALVLFMSIGLIIFAYLPNIFSYVRFLFLQND